MNNATLVPMKLIERSILLVRGQHHKYPPYAFTGQGVAMRTHSTVNVQSE
jgi:hypothetical protein